MRGVAQWVEPCTFRNSHRRHFFLFGPVSTSEGCGRTLAHMATPFLIGLVYLGVLAGVLYLVVRLGVRDGMTDFENRRGRDLRR
jgi:hypothetical protein